MQGATRAQQPLQHHFNPGLAFPGRQVQDLHVLLGGTPRLLGPQRVIRQAKATAGEQVVAVAVVREGARLAHQPVDDVPIVNAVLAAAPQARQPFHQPLGVPDLDVVGVQTGLDPFPNESAGHRVGVALHVDSAAAIDPHPHALAGFQTTRRQGP